MVLAKYKCEFCPTLFRNRGLEIPVPLLAPEGETIELPYVWIASRSPKKVEECASSFRVIVDTISKIGVNIGRMIAFPADIMPESPAEDDHMEGRRIAEKKVLDYFRAFAGYDAVKNCHRYNKCFKDQIFIANDVNVWAGVSGQPFTESLRKPMGEGIKTKEALVDFIVAKYQSLGPAQFVVNRIEASIAMLKPTSQDWKDESQLRIQSGVARTHVQLPWANMVDPVFIRKYVNYASSKSGGLENLLKAAGGIMTEYLVNCLIDEGEEVSVSMVHDSRYAGKESELFLANARGFPPRLMWGVLQKMLGNSPSGAGEELIMQPDGTDKDMWISAKMKV